MKALSHFRFDSWGVLAPPLGTSAAFVLLCLLVLTAPIAWGGVLPGGTFVIEVLACSAAALSFTAPSLASAPATPRVPVVGLALLAFLGALQLVPAPISLLDRVSPGSAAVYRETATVLASQGAPSPPARVSIAPTETASQLLFVLALLGAFLTARRLLVTRPRRRVFLGALFLSAVTSVVWATAFDEAQRRHGPFVNPNHLAGYLQVSVAPALALIWLALVRTQDSGASLADEADRLERRALPVVLATLLWATLAGGIILTQSRAGLAAAVLGTLFVLSCLVARRRAGRRSAAALPAAVALAAGIGFVVFSTGLFPLTRALETKPGDLGVETRLGIWRGSLEAFRSFPVLGSGLGAFPEAFRRVQPPGLTGLVEQAHSEPLQILVTGGFVGVLLGTAVLGGCALFLLRAALRPGHREETAFLLGALGAIVSLSLHGLVEFNFSIPAIPVTLAALAGGGTAAAAAVTGTRRRVAADAVTRPART